MKNLLLFLVLVIVTISTAFASTTDDTTRYQIVYAKGLHTLYPKAGDQIGSENLVFYETADQFKRGKDINKIIPFSSHGIEFWLTEVRMREDTMDGSIAVTILSAKVSKNPTVLLANTNYGLDTDQNETDDPIPWYWWIAIFTPVLCGCYLAIRRWA